MAFRSVPYNRGKWNRDSLCLRCRIIAVPDVYCLGCPLPRREQRSVIRVVEKTQFAFSKNYLQERWSVRRKRRTELSPEVHRPPKHPLARDNLPSRVPPKKNPMKSSAKMKGRPCVRSTFANPSPRQMVVEKFPDVVLEIHKARISNL
uniref:Uncharacterized protein n=1 Tax=Vespula pensylvanica TaxID=30213 RepID=A0A834KCP2_VESPE|nr:hypothetical protein H0235_014804 [Vespula pensylvanica]